MKVYDSYITINIDSKEKEMLNKIAIRKGKKGKNRITSIRK